LLTEIFPPIESARQESNRAHGFLERAHARPRGNDERLTESRHVSLMHEPGEAIRSTDDTEALMQVSHKHHDHRQWHRYCSRLCARKHRRDHRVLVGRVRHRMVHRSAARAPPRTDAAAASPPPIAPDTK